MGSSGPSSLPPPPGGSVGWAAPPCFSSHAGDPVCTGPVVTDQDAQTLPHVLTFLKYLAPFYMLPGDFANPNHTHCAPRGAGIIFPGTKMPGLPVLTKPSPPSQKSPSTAARLQIPQRRVCSSRPRPPPTPQILRVHGFSPRCEDSHSMPDRCAWPLTGAAAGSGTRGESGRYYQVGSGGTGVHEGGQLRPEPQASGSECHEVLRAVDGPGGEHAGWGARPRQR